MLDLEEINNTIEELEHSNTTFANCEKLASLYIVRNYFKTTELPGYHVSESVYEKDTIKELNDILPQYNIYCETKRKYQLHQLTDEAVILAMKDVCKEILEFITTLYNHTEFEQERVEIENLISELNTKY